MTFIKINNGRELIKNKSVRVSILRGVDKEVNTSTISII